MRYDYASYKSRRSAESALEDMYASGTVSPGEHPRIEKRGMWYVITLEG